MRIPRKLKKRWKKLLNKVVNRDYFAEEIESNKIKAGDTVLVFCPMFQDEPVEEVVERIDGGWAIFKGDSGKIQLEYCQKHNY